MWSLIEPCVGMVAGSLPYIRPLCRRRFKTPKRSNDGRQAGGDENGTGIWIKRAFTVETRSATPLDDLCTQTMVNVLSGQSIVNTSSGQMTIDTSGDQTMIDERSRSKSRTV